MTKKITAKFEFDEDDIDEILEDIDYLKSLIDELKELRELQDERLQSDDPPAKGTASPKKT